MGLHEQSYHRCDRCGAEEQVSDADVILMTAHVEDETMLRAIEATARAKIENARLRREKAWLERRISEEDARLSHA